MSPLAPDDLYARWVEWIDTIATETISLWSYRDYWQGLAEMTPANPDIPPSTIFNVLGIWYGAATTTGIRRQLDRDPRSVSLWRLLTGMADRPDVMTRERHVAIWLIDSYDDDEWRTREGEQGPPFARDLSIYWS